MFDPNDAEGPLDRWLMRVDAWHRALLYVVLVAVLGGVCGVLVAPSAVGLGDATARTYGVSFIAGTGPGWDTVHPSVADWLALKRALHGLWLALAAAPLAMLLLAGPVSRWLGRRGGYRDLAWGATQRLYDQLAEGLHAGLEPGERVELCTAAPASLAAGCDTRLLAGWVTYLSGLRLVVPLTILAICSGCPTSVVAALRGYEAAVLASAMLLLLAVAARPADGGAGLATTAWLLSALFVGGLWGLLARESGMPIWDDHLFVPVVLLILAACVLRVLARSRVVDHFVAVTNRHLLVVRGRRRPLRRKLRWEEPWVVSRVRAVRVQTPTGAAVDLEADGRKERVRLVTRRQADELIAALEARELMQEAEPTRRERRSVWYELIAWAGVAIAAAWCPLGARASAQVDFEGMILARVVLVNALTPHMRRTEPEKWLKYREDTSALVPTFRQLAPNNPCLLYDAACLELAYDRPENVQPLAQRILEIIGDGRRGGRRVRDAAITWLLYPPTRTAPETAAGDATADDQGAGP